MGVFDDDLTDADMEFLDRFNKLGRSESADSEYNPSQEELPEPQGEGESNYEGDVQAEGEQGGEGESDLPDDDRQTDIEGDSEGEAESDEGDIDESKMDISDIEPEQPESESSKDAEEKDHLETGDDDSEYDGTDDSELEYDQLGDQDETKDDELPPEHPEEFPQDQPDDLHDDGSKIEEDDGEGERGNSDEARESDEPIGGSDSEDEPQEGSEQEAKADAEQEMEGDAQQELEAHLENEQDDSEPEGDSEQQPEDESEGSSDKDESKDEQQGSGGGEGNDFSDLPGQSENCANHCEDNEGEGEHECPRCAERIMRERKLWGVIATDMHGNDVYPGDKVRVVIPMSFFTQDTILTANVPNEEMDRVAVKTDETVDAKACWLSGARISQFTGYHLKGGGPIWTFTKGRVLRFAEKIGEPEREGGGQGDIEDMIEKLHDDLDNFDQGKDLSEEENQNDLDDEGDEQEQDEQDDEHRNGGKGSLTSTQMKRFENLFDRIEKKIEQTFGNTAETVERGEIVETNDGQIARPIVIKSRGVKYSVVLVANRDDA